jgi:hypothetical protein
MSAFLYSQLTGIYAMKIYLRGTTTQRFITILTAACHHCLSWVRWMHSRPSVAENCSYLFLKSFLLCKVGLFLEVALMFLSTCILEIWFKSVGWKWGYVYYMFVNVKFQVLSEPLCTYICLFIFHMHVCRMMTFCVWFNIFILISMCAHTCTHYAKYCADWTISSIIFVHLFISINTCQSDCCLINNVYCYMQFPFHYWCPLFLSLCLLIHYYVYRGQWPVCYLCLCLCVSVCTS